MKISVNFHPFFLKKILTLSSLGCTWTFCIVKSYSMCMHVCLFLFICVNVDARVLQICAWKSEESPSYLCVCSPLFVIEFLVGSPWISHASWASSFWVFPLSKLPVSSMELYMVTITPVFTWALGSWTQVLTLKQQALCKLDHFTSPMTLSFSFSCF